MKQLSFFLFTMALTIGSFAQQTETPSASTRQDYLAKSSDQKKAAWILLGGGLGLTLIGGALLGSELEAGFSGSGSDGGGSLVLGTAGLFAMLGSIPLFIASGRNARKAATVGFNLKSLPIPYQNTFVLKSQSTLSLKVSF